MKTFSGIISPKVTILQFSHKNVGMILHTLYFFYNNSLLHGHENYRRLIFEVIDFDPEKSKEKVVQDFWRSVYIFGICLCSMLTCLLNLQILAQNDIFSILAYFGGHFLLP